MTYQPPEELTDRELLDLWRQAKSLFRVLDNVVRSRGLAKCPDCTRHHLPTVDCAGRPVDDARRTR